MGAITDDTWEIRTIEFANCNCAYGCPCQFNAYHTYGKCGAVVCNEIVKATRRRQAGRSTLRRRASVAQGRFHEGNGKADNLRSTNVRARQREAILKIMSGQITISLRRYSLSRIDLTEAYDPIFAPIEL